MLGWIAAAVLACALVLVIVLYERELGGMARFLRRGDRSANERVSVSFSTPGISSIASAVNDEMDALRDERAAIGEQRQAFQRDLAALSHDIRTPLAGAQGYLQLHERSSDTGERARCLSEAASRLEAMRDLTDKLFDYAKAADGDSPLALEPVEVMPVLASVLASAYPQFAQRGWEPTVRFDDEDACALADAEALARVFSNLLTNALRYGAAAPVISQRFVPAPGGEGRETMAVTFSNPVGNAASIDAERLFERFYRADSARSGGGSGLGLAIVASLCERMGGSAEARIEDGALSITVTLPAVRA